MDLTNPVLEIELQQCAHDFNLIFTGNFFFYVICGLSTEHRAVLRSDEGLTLETSVQETLYGDQFTSSTQLIKPNLSPYGLLSDLVLLLFP